MIHDSVGRAANVQIAQCFEYEGEDWEGVFTPWAPYIVFAIGNVIEADTVYTKEYEEKKWKGVFIPSLKVPFSYAICTERSVLFYNVW